MADTLSRLTAREAASATVTLAADPDDAPKLQAAVDDVKRAQRLLDAAGPDELVRAERRLEDAIAAHEKVAADIVTIAWSMQGIGPTFVEELIGKHPTGNRASRRAAAEAQWNEETFPQALIAAVTTRVEFSDDPDGALTGITEAQMAELWKSTLSVQDRGLLFVTALGLDQRGSSLTDLGKG